MHARRRQTNTVAPADVTGRLVVPTDEAEGTPVDCGPGSPDAVEASSGHRPARRAIAARTSQPPAIDGRLDDPVWRDVTPITAFVQTSPVEGAAATEATEVWLAYDSDKIYVAFYATLRRHGDRPGE